MKQDAKFLNRKTPPTLFTLVVVSGVSALAMNLFLPSLPAIADFFGSEYAFIQFAVTGYLALTGLLQLIIGPIADRFGRRAVLVGGFAVFMLASLGCALAPNETVFMAFRFLQAVVAGGMALSRAIIRDMVSAEEAASMIGYVTMGMAVMPMLGPMLGGVLQHQFGWQANFYALSVLGALTLAIVFFDLGETHRSQFSSFRAQFATYPELLRSRRFWGYSAVAAFASGSFFSLLGGGPYVASEVLGMSPRAMGFGFGLIAAGYMIGNFFSGLFSKSKGVAWMIKCGALVGIFGMALSLSLFLLGFNHPASFFGCIVFVGLGNGLSLPSATSGLLSVKPELAGTASGLSAALMVGGGSVLASVTGTLLNPESGPYPLILMMLTSAVCGLVAAIYTTRLERKLNAT